MAISDIKISQQEMIKNVLNNLFPKSDFVWYKAANCEKAIEKIPNTQP